LLLSGAISIAILPDPFVEWVIRSLFSYATEGKLDSKFWPPLSFFTLIILGLIFGIWEHRDSKDKAHLLVDRLTKLGNFSINKSIVKIYFGSIENIYGIDVVVSSEDTTLDLGSINGSSVSGRVRKISATFNHRNEVIKDDLHDFITSWKNQQGSLGPYNKGTCIISPPFNSSSRGVKCIINAIAIEKRAGKPAVIDESSIRTIVDFSINHAIKSEYSSVFIPVFGLGSGNASQNEAIETTVDAVNFVLQKTSASLIIYLGVYKEADNLALISKLTAVAE
jgi:O-acetyl-ADP-ribose deacetylase (regulator of RNase III)